MGRKKLVFLAILGLSLFGGYKLYLLRMSALPGDVQMGSNHVSQNPGKMPVDPEDDSFSEIDLEGEDSLEEHPHSVRVSTDEENTPITSAVLKDAPQKDAPTLSSNSPNVGDLELQLGMRLQSALESEAEAQIFFEEMEGCISDPEANDSVQSICRKYANSVARRYPELGVRLGALKVDPKSPQEFSDDED
jgi:hypothetical protein